MDNNNNNIYHMFPASNTSQGFYSLFDYILPIADANRVIYIKGGPGTGKSYLMKKIGDIFSKKGYTIEFFHCSSDNESLDAVLIKELNIALVDGTAPHIRDPKIPGALDEILNLGECLDEKSLSNFKEDLKKISSDIEISYKQAFSYFSSARCIHNNLSAYNSSCLDIVKLNTLKQSLIKSIFKNPKIGHGKERHLFATAFTPNGIISYIDTLYKNCDNIYTLNGGPGTCKTNILTTLKDTAINSGHNVTIFHDPLIPNRIEHIIIPHLSTAILTSNEINNKTFNGTQFYMSTLMDKNIINTKNNLIKKDTDFFYNLLNEGLSRLSNCKKLHNKLENYYIKNIDYDKVNLLSEELIKKLLTFIED